MSDILFGQSYTLRFDPKLFQAMQPYPPLGTLYAASLAREAGYSAAVYDAMLSDSFTEWETAISTHRPRFAVLFEDNFNYLSKMCLLNMRAAAFEMIQSARAAGCQVIVGGSDATDHAEAYLLAGADFVLIGEGDATLIELLNKLTSGASDFAGIPGLAWREGQEIQSSGRRPDIKNLDPLPLPARDLIDMEMYARVWREHHGYYSMNMATTRGCPFHCNWCAKPIWGQRYNSRSPENVAQELAHIKEVYRPDHIWFVDDIFGLKPGWVAAFAEQLQAFRAHIPFKCLSRADLLLRPGEIQALRDSGCQIVWIGAESGSQKVLDAMEKGTTVDQIHTAARQLKAVGIQVGFFLQFGYPGETWAEIEQTLHLVRDCQPDDIGISVSYPLPGTTFHARVRDQLHSKANWIDSSDLDMLYAGPFSTPFYRQLHTVVHKEFRARQTLKRLLAHHPVSAHKAAAMLAQAITLPFARWKLKKLARPLAGQLIELAPNLSPTEAARPTPQD